MHHEIDGITLRAPLRGSPRLADWEHETRQALQAQRAGRTAPALAGHRRSLVLALGLIEHPVPGSADHCVAALVVSHHNLADLLLAEGDEEGAVGHLCGAHESLMGIFADTARNAELRHAALRHSRETHAALLRHATLRGAYPSIRRALRVGDLALRAGSAPAH